MTCASFYAMNADTASTTKPLSLAERKALLSEMAAQPDAPAGIRLIDVREPTEREIAFGNSLERLARAALERNARAVA